ncbi:hypothetical protein BDZ89DRAFT_1075284, partial [Hymenopellis radicata]
DIGESAPLQRCYHDMPQLVSSMTSSSDSPSYVSGSMELASVRSYSHKIKLSRSAKPIQACAASVCGSLKWGMSSDDVVGAIRSGSCGRKDEEVIVFQVVVLGSC